MIQQRSVAQSMAHSNYGADSGATVVQGVYNVYPHPPTHPTHPTPNPPVVAPRRCTFGTVCKPVEHILEHIIRVMLDGTYRKGIAKVPVEATTSW